MFLDPQSFIVFVGAFVVCGALLSMIFFTGDDFAVLRRMTGAPARSGGGRGVGNSPAAVEQAKRYITAAINGSIRWGRTTGLDHRVRPDR